MNRKDVLDILDYWITISFLEQESYAQTTGEFDCRKNVKEHLRAGEKSNRKQIWDFIDWDFAGVSSPIKTVRKESLRLKMESYGNITVYAGSIKREKCIRSLAEYMNVTEEDLNRVETAADSIVLFSLQMNSEGRLISGTLSLSTIVWALYRIAQAGGGRLSDVISPIEYRKDMKELEKKLPADEELSAADFCRLFSEIENTYVKKYIKDLQKAEKTAAKTQKADFEEKYGLKVQFFKDQKAQENYEDDEYFGLAHDYFSTDLLMVEEQIEKGNLDHAKGMPGSLLDYIVSAGNESANRPRHDLVNPKKTKESMEDFEKIMLEVLNVRNAPLGKWPSRYNPSVMQQAAINFAVSGGKPGLFAEYGSIFSVNGPPGTGKTTLLKEIVSGNIVEKARLLSEYANPDDAFTAHKLRTDGLKKHPNWHSLREKADSINDYSVLVTSCNNAAVENISKELPIGTGIQAGLRSNDSDSAKMKRQLTENARLFSVADAQKTLSVSSNDDDSVSAQNEIYFSGYAKNLFGENAWGLVAAPLGKKSNVLDLYRKFIKKLRYELMLKNDDLKARKDDYLKSRRIFLDQLKLAENMQEELAGYSDAALQCIVQTEFYTRKIEETSAKQKQFRDREADAAQKKKKLEEEEKKIDEAYAVAAVNCAAEQKNHEQAEATAEEITQRAIEFRKKVLETEDSVGAFGKLFKSNKFKDAMKLADLYRQKASQAEQEQKTADEKCNIAKTAFEKAQSERDRIEEKRKGLQEQIALVEKEKRDCAAEADKCVQDLVDFDASIQKYQENMNRARQALETGDETKRGVFFDREFAEELLSDDVIKSTKAQTTDPWITDAYNRAREKLLYDALQMTRDFVLSSKACQMNLDLLAMYWGYKKMMRTSRLCFVRKT